MGRLLRRKDRNRLGSIRLRLTAWYVLFLGVILLAFSLGVYFFLSASVAADVSGVEQSYQRILTSYAAVSPRQLVRNAPRESSLLGQIAIRYQAKNDASGQQTSIGPVPSASANRELEAALISQKQGCHIRGGDHLACTWLVYSHKSHHLLGAVNLQASLANVFGAQNRLATALLFGIPVCLLIALAGGWILASRALSPVEDLRRTAQSITATDLTRRIGSHRADELGRLARTLDDMIDRLDTAFREQQQLTADCRTSYVPPLP